MIAARVDEDNSTPCWNFFTTKGARGTGGLAMVPMASPERPRRDASRSTAPLGEGPSMRLVFPGQMVDTQIPRCLKVLEKTAAATSVWCIDDEPAILGVLVETAGSILGIKRRRLPAAEQGLSSSVALAPESILRCRHHPTWACQEWTAEPLPDTSV